MKKLDENNRACLSLYFLSNDTVVVHTPHDGWGVIDCYETRTESQKNGTLTFLLGKGVDKLDFVCLTHLHYDHYRGMSRLLRHFKGKIDEFWDSGDIDLVRTMRMAFSESTWKKETSELERIYRYVYEWVKKGEMLYKRMGENITLYTENGLKIKSLSPVGNVMLRAKRGRFLNFNAFSAVLMVDYAGVSVLLGGDAESNTWKALLKRKIPLVSNIVKVSHHGSRAGMPPEALRQMFIPEKSFAIVVPLPKHNLPSSRVLFDIESKKVGVIETIDTGIKFDISKNGKYEWAYIR